MNLEHRSGDGPVVYNVVNYHSNIQIGKINTETDMLPNMLYLKVKLSNFVKVKSLNGPESGLPDPRRLGK